MKKKRGEIPSFFIEKVRENLWIKESFLHNLWITCVENRVIQKVFHNINRVIHKEKYLIM